MDNVLVNLVMVVENVMSVKQITGVIHMFSAIVSSKFYIIFYHLVKFMNFVHYTRSGY